jgi:hypothetical protein
MRRNLKSLGPYALPATERLRHQWAQVIEFKSDMSRDGARTRNSWRMKTADKVGIRLEWCMILDGRVCVSAGMAYKQISRFLGFLALPREEGGRNICATTLDTIAWLVRPELVIAFVKWTRARSDGLRHQGLFNFLHMARSFLRPETGFLWLHPSFADSLSPDMAECPSPAGAAGNWQQRCEQAWKQIGDFERKLKAEGKPQKSRDPKEALREYVSNEFPMRELVRLVSAIEADPPQKRQRRSYAAWIRDVLLLKMLIRHPLRAHHFSIMKFRGPGAHLQRSGSTWNLRFSVEDFKNAESSSATDYEVTFVDSLAAWLNRYLVEARPLMYGADTCDYLFLPSQTAGAVRKQENETNILPTGAWSTHGIYGRMKQLTAHYSATGLGLNPHAPRHILATDHLRRSPRDYAVVAKILNDSLETVIREYIHLEISDGVRAVSDSIEIASRELNVAL